MKGRKKRKLKDEYDIFCEKLNKEIEIELACSNYSEDLADYLTQEFQN